MTDVRLLLRDAVEALGDAGVATPRVDAELLLAAALGVPRNALLTRADVPPRAARTFAAMITERAARRPLQHITGTAPFRHLLLAVGPGVFVPRPETELLVDAVLPHLLLLDDPQVVDLCSGSGALALAIAQEVPGSQVAAVERSVSALRWMARNAAGTAVRVIEGDVTDPDLLGALHGRADAVVCNPPYVPSRTEVDPEVRADPAEAVFAGRDGLELMAAVIERAADLLRPGGVFAVEHDDTHGSAVPALLELDGRWHDIEAHRDLAGRPRFATATRQG